MSDARTANARSDAQDGGVARGDGGLRGRSGARGDPGRGLRPRALQGRPGARHLRRALGPGHPRRHAHGGRQVLVLPDPRPHEGSGGGHHPRSVPAGQPDEGPGGVAEAQARRPRRRRGAALQGARKGEARDRASGPLGSLARTLRRPRKAPLASVLRVPQAGGGGEGRLAPRRGRGPLHLGVGPLLQARVPLPWPGYRRHCLQEDRRGRQRIPKSPDTRPHRHGRPEGTRGHSCLAGNGGPGGGRHGLRQAEPLLRG